jgi:hypothetical protein
LGTDIGASAGTDAATGVDSGKGAYAALPSSPQHGLSLTLPSACGAGGGEEGRGEWEVQDAE